MRNKGSSSKMGVYAPWRRAQQRFKEVRVLATLFATDLGWSDAYTDPAVYSDRPGNWPQPAFLRSRR